MGRLEATSIVILTLLVVLGISRRSVAAGEGAALLECRAAAQDRLGNAIRNCL